MKNISLFTLVEIALKHIFIIVAAALVAAVGAFCFCEFLASPKYSATGSIMVTNGAIVSTGGSVTSGSLENGDSLNNTDIQASLNFANTVTDILNTNGIFKELSEELSGKYTYSELKSFATVARRSTNTLFIDISFTSHDREEAIELVNTYLELAPGYINTFVPQSAVTATSVADTANKIFPRTLIITAAAAVVGAAIAYAIIFLIYCANTVIKGEEDFKERFDIPVLGCIPDFSTAKNEKYYKKYSYYGKGGNVSNGK